MKSQGWNTLLLKITQNNQGWEFCARVAQPDGARREGLGFAAAFEEEAGDRLCGALGAESQRDSILQPRVARHELPWDTRTPPRQPCKGLQPGSGQTKLARRLQLVQYFSKCDG